MCEMSWNVKRFKLGVALALALGLLFALGMGIVLQSRSLAQAQPPLDVGIPHHIISSRLEQTSEFDHAPARTPFAPAASFVAPPTSGASIPLDAPAVSTFLPPFQSPQRDADRMPALTLLADSALLGGSAALVRQPARAGESASTLDSINQVLAAEGFAVDLHRDAVWGYVNPGDAVTVTRTAGGDAYGAAEADGVGFFWTPLWHDGYGVDVQAGDTIEFYVNGALEATIIPRAISGQVNLLADTVTGTVAGLTEGTVVTATMLDYTWLRYDLVVGSTAVDDSGNFTIDFTGVDNIGPHEMAQVFYRDVNGNAIIDYLYPYGAFRVRDWNWVEGFASEGASVDVTVYITYPTDVRWSDSTSVGNPPFYQFNGNIEYDDVVEIVINGSTPYSVTAYYMDMRPDAANDQITGYALPGATVRAQLRDDFDHVAEDAETVADGSGAYTSTLSSDLRT
ncbi:MAG TPA: hypothetical protein ENN19_11690, partial [Chloroflexi bacterium]|nr:hypothetical protein [Chloroflexota bacterium]